MKNIGASKRKMFKCSKKYLGAGAKYILGILVVSRNNIFNIILPPTRPPHPILKYPLLNQL